MLKKPSVDGTYTEKIMVATHTKAVEIAVTAKVKGDVVFF
jgi:hypothetical protein